MALLVGCVCVCVCLRCIGGLWVSRTNAAHSSAHGLVNKGNTFVLICHKSTLLMLNIDTHTHTTCAGTPGEFRQHVSVSQWVVPIKTAMPKSDPPLLVFSHPPKAPRANAVAHQTNTCALQYIHAVICVQEEAVWFELVLLGKRECPLFIYPVWEYWNTRLLLYLVPWMALKSHMATMVTIANACMAMKHRRLYSPFFGLFLYLSKNVVCRIPHLIPIIASGFMIFPKSCDQRDKKARKALRRARGEYVIRGFDDTCHPLFISPGLWNWPHYAGGPPLFEGNNMSSKGPWGNGANFSDENLGLQLMISFISSLSFNCVFQFRDKWCIKCQKIVENCNVSFREPKKAPNISMPIRRILEHVD